MAARSLRPCGWMPKEAIPTRHDAVAVFKVPYLVTASLNISVMRFDRHRAPRRLSVGLAQVGCISPTLVLN